MRQVDQLNQLGPEDIKEKIARAEKDIKRMQEDGSQTKQADLLIEYKQYLQDELENLEKSLQKPK
jgi:hypothetical protein